MNLKDKTVLLTGGSLGIGKATAALLIEKGAKVAITGRDAARVQAAADEIGALAICADVGNPDDIDRTYAEFLQAFGHLDVLINNAGIGGSFARLEAVEWDDFEQVFRVNVFGAALMGKHAAHLFMAQNHGNIINIGSTASLKGFARGSVYSASKFALRSLSQSWADELRKHNVRVMQINPSEVKTAFANADRVERPEEDNKLRSQEIAHAIITALEMDDRGFIPELSVWATNPF
ncbi:MAG: SDR family NAD(P)-dependent oxidoreductase [Bacteroidia bacterium]|nr:SDR family NAD(P)-dependent oxidoreductase [Bacteroidia bacterium]